jgi:hypothetical protein
MKEDKKELVVLTPQPAFYSFVCNHLPIKAQPQIELFNIDQTAYFIDAHASVNAVVDEIEKNFSRILLYEARRWLGRYFQFDKPPSFYQFANWFDLQFHQNVYALKSDEHQGALHGVQIKPKDKLLPYIQGNGLLPEFLSKKIVLSQVQENASFFLHRLETLSEVSQFLSSNYRMLSEFEKRRLALKKLPKMDNFSAFQHFFEVSLHQRIKLLTTLEKEI